MALHSLYCADVPLRNCSLTHSLIHCYKLPSFISVFSNEHCFAIS